MSAKFLELLFITLGSHKSRSHGLCTVKSHFKAQGLYNFKGSLGWAYKPGGGGGGTGGAYIRVGL